MKLLLSITLLVALCGGCITKRTTDRGTTWELNWPKSNNTHEAQTPKN